MNWFSKIFLITILTALPLTLFAAPAAPEEESTIYVDAEQYTGLQDKSVELVGKVKVIRGLEMLTCDRATVDMVKQEVTGIGNVTFISPTNYVRSERFIYNFKTKTGIIFNGFLQTGQETIEGEEIIKNEDGSYTGRYASYTSCTNCPAGWKVSGTNINATKGSYAFITNPIIKIYGIPILWLPYMVIPIKNERQSGFLAPGFGVHEDHGFTFTESFFWAINRSTDMTITGTSYARRGIKGGLEYRYVADQNSSGMFRGFFLNDKKFGKDPKYTSPDPAYNIAPREPVSAVARFGVTYGHRFELPNGYTNTAQIKLVRDSFYVNDFPDDIGSKGDPALDNRFTLTKNTENSNTSLDTSLYQDLLKADPMGDNRYAIHRVPSLNYSVFLPRISGTNLLSKVDFQYLNLARAYRTFDGKNEFDPLYAKSDFSEFTDGSRYRTGQRFRFTPTLYYPISFGDYLDLVPEVNYEETYYQFGYGTKPRAQRRFLRTTLQAKTSLSSVLVSDDSLKPRYKHQIEPEITYTSVPYVEQDNHPFFGNSEQKFLPRFTANQPITEFDNLQFDSSDRLTDQQIVTFAVVNKLIRKRKTEDDAWGYKQIVRHRLSQSYDLANAYDSTPNIVKQPWSEIRSQLEIRLDYITLNSDISYFPYQNITTHGNGIGVSDRWGNSITLGYSQSFAFQTDTTTGLPLRRVDISNRSETAFADFGLRTKYLDLNNNYQYDVVVKELKSINFSGLLKPPGKCWGLLFTYTKPIEGGAAYNIDIPFYFGEGKSYQINTKKPGGGFM